MLWETIDYNNSNREFLQNTPTKHTTLETTLYYNVFFSHPPNTVLSNHHSLIFHLTKFISLSLFPRFSHALALEMYDLLLMKQSSSHWHHSGHIEGCQQVLVMKNTLLAIKI